MIKNNFPNNKENKSAKAFTFKPSQPSSIVAPSLVSPSDVYDLVLSGKTAALKQYFNTPDYSPKDENIKSLLLTTCEANEVFQIYKISVNNFLLLLRNQHNSTSANSSSAHLMLIEENLSNIKALINSCSQKRVSVTQIETSYVDLAEIQDFCLKSFNSILKQLSEKFLVDKYSFNSVVLSSNLSKQKDYYKNIEARKLAKSANLAKVNI